MRPADPSTRPWTTRRPGGPAILTTGTRDMLLSDTVLLRRALRRAGVPAELHVTEAAGHGGFMGMAPEDQEIRREVRRFADAHWAKETQ
ncbi:MAG TPA: hypothetical protein VF838_03000 [Trebonia sp.]